MTKKCTILVKDEINIKLLGLNDNVKLRKQIVQKLQFFVPYAYHVPAFKLGRWDGMKSYATVGGETYLNLLDQVLPFIEDAGYAIDIDDQRQQWDINFPTIEEVRERLAQKVWPEDHPAAGEPIVLRDYQEDVIKHLMENQQSIVEAATGAGKTIISATLSYVCEKMGRTIIIVPSKSLVTQTEEDYKNLGLDVGVFYGDRKEFGHQHTICTWQSLNALDKKTANKKHGLLTDQDIHDFMDGVVCVMCDEVHGLKADVLFNLLKGPFRNVPIRWGFTGTVPKEDYNFISLLAGLGPVVYRVTANQLQDKGVLADLEIDVVQTQEPFKFADYHAEYQFLTTEQARIHWLGGYIKEIAKEGNTLILIDRISTGEMLEEMFEECVFIHGNVKNEKRREHFKDVNASDNKIMIATYGTAAVGLNIPRIFNLVLLEPGKSFVRVIQSIGRSIRIAKDKDFARVFDVCSACKYSKKHLTERKKYYREAKYPFKVKKVTY